MMNSTSGDLGPLLIQVTKSPLQPAAALPLLVDVPEARRQLGNMSRSGLYELLKEGTLKSIRIGRKRLIFSASIEAFVKQLASEQGQ